MNTDDLLKNAVCGECRAPLPNHSSMCSAGKSDPYRAAREKMGEKVPTRCPDCGKYSVLLIDEQRVKCSSCGWGETAPKSEPSVPQSYSGCCDKLPELSSIGVTACGFTTHCCPVCKTSYRSRYFDHGWLWEKEPTEKPPVDPYQFARDTFSTYAAMDAPNLPTENGLKISALQVQLHRWHVRQFDSCTLAGKALGISEELGEAVDALLGMASCAGKISHAILKHDDGIRGMDDELAFRKKLADAIADNTIFAIQLCTMLRLDYGALLQATVEEVIKRNWKKDAKSGGV